MTDTATPASDSATSAELAPVIKEAVAKVKAGSIDFDDLLKLVAPPAERLPLPAKLPSPAKITDDERTALGKLTRVFGKVVPTERREITAAEVDLLLEEREVLKTIEGLVERRKDDIRTTVLNHFDLAYEATLPRDDNGAPVVPDDVYRDKDGHYVVGQHINGAESEKCFSGEPRKGSVVVTAADLEALEGQGEITHEDYLSMTEQTRSFDQNKAMLYLKRKPGLIAKLAKVSRRGTPTINVSPRKAK